MENRNVTIWDGGVRIWSGSLADFIATNDEFSTEDGQDMARQLDESGEVRLGGGAAPLFVMTPNENVYQRFTRADREWQAELEKTFGKEAGDYRYHPAAYGEAGTPLRAAYERFAAARDAYEAWVAANR